MLQLEQVTKQYSTTTVLSVDTFTIQDGIVLLQGGNGSGKTTLLKMIAGLLPFEGDIILNNASSLKKQRTAFVRCINYAETEPLYPGFLTAKELVKLFCYAKKGNITTTEFLLRQLHIYDVYKKPLSTYSSGMIKKLSLALAFVGNPQWILLDEPLITTDQNAVDTICSMIHEKHHKEQVSFLITSHQSFNSSRISFTSRLLAYDHTLTVAV
ncbi:MAG TPA: ATP-binding cassette domain-containing protein [Parafilimonas sp.]|nr:ATP-binding cassette domain-containing protein [Parafilimonas sp.]